MPMYTVEIQVSNEDGSIWQAAHPAETCDADTATDAAVWTATNQTVVDREGPGGWRVQAWAGADADTGLQPDAEVYGWYPGAGEPFESGLVRGLCRPGYVAGACGHAVAESEWRAGFRTCERCPQI